MKLFPFILPILAALLTSCAMTEPPTAPLYNPRVDAAQAGASLTPAGEPLPEPPHETARISFLAAGDNVIHPCIYIDARYRAKNYPDYNFLPMYADCMDFIASHDLAFINQETLMGGNRLGLSGYPRFNSPQELGRDLVTVGFDIISIANNHMCDKGDEGLSGTIDYLSELPVTLLGGHRNEADFNTIRTIERDGIVLAFLSYTYGTNGYKLSAESEMVIPYIDEETIVRQCREAEQAADLTIVSVHWGDENKPVNNSQKSLARLMAESGADVILGHHPHVLQPIEWIETDAGRTLCIYSLGNLVSAMQYWQNMVGGFLTFEIVGMSDGEVFLENPAFVPTAFFYGPSYYNSHLYFLNEYPKSKAEQHGTGKMYESPASPADMVNYAKSIMGDYLKLDPNA